jgi:hypothetical protein
MMISCAFGYGVLTNKVEASEISISALQTQYNTILDKLDCIRTELSTVSGQLDTYMKMNK